MTNRPMFPHTFDSTMLAAFRSCPQKMFRTYVEHWKPKTESVHLVAGGAFAKGIEVARKVYFEGLYPAYGRFHHEDGGEYSKQLEGDLAWAPGAKGDKQVAEAEGLRALMIAYGDFECPADSAKSLERTAGALEFYFDQYPLDTDSKVPVTFVDGRRGIEFSFALPLGVNHPVTGDPILYTGRADMIAEFAGGIYIVDEKTTSSLGASWSRQWEMRGQFTGYCWAAKESGIPVSGAIIRGVSILKTKYDTQEAITNRAQHEIDRWKFQSERDITRAIAMWKEGYWDYALDGACAEYGGCSLVDICKSPSPEDWLPIRFEQRVWDPLARKQLTVPEWEASWGHGTSHA